MIQKTIFTLNIQPNKINNWFFRYLDEMKVLLS